MKHFMQGNDGACYTALQAGFTLIEVLVTFLVISIGLLGLVALQTNTVSDQLEAQQRAQISSVLDDMASRIRLDPEAAVQGAYWVERAEEYGLLDLGDCSQASGAARDLCEWNELLKGLARNADGDGVADPLGARGCIDALDAQTGSTTRIRVTVVWQGLVKSAPPTSDCGRNDFGDEAYRRVLYRDVVVINPS